MSGKTAGSVSAPGSHVERRAVTRANDAFALEFALVERRAVVRADVFDRVDLPAGVAEQNFHRIHDDSPGRSRGDLGKFCYSVLSHASSFYVFSLRSF